MSIACTDNNIVYINGANPLSTSFPTMELKTASYDGLNGHEVGHVLFSDFGELNKRIDAFWSGSFYPKIPTTDNEIEQESLEEILYYYSSKDPVVIGVFATVGTFLNNAIEDVWMEYKMMEKFPGNIRKGIHLNAIRMMEQVDSLYEMMQDNHYESFDICNALVLQYVRCGNINNWHQLENHYTDFLSTVTDILDDAVFEDVTEKRYQSVNLCLVKMWSVIKEEIEKIRKLPPKPQNSSSGGMGNKSHSTTETKGHPDTISKGSEAGNPPAGKAAALNEQEKEKLSNFKRRVEESKAGKMFRQMPKGQICAPALPKEEIKGRGEKDNRKEFRDTLKNQLHEISEPERFTTEGREVIFMDAFSEEKEKVTAFGGDINAELNSYLHKQVMEQVNKKEEKALAKQLETDFSNADLTRLHNVPRRIERILHVPDTYVEAYKAIYPEIHKISMRLQKEMETILKAKEGGIEQGMYIGKALDRHNLYRQDGKIFCKKINPDDGVSLALGVVIDTSGSMSGERIQMAKLAALVLYDFCKGLQIPVAIYGHSVLGGKVNIASYAEFDAVDQKDCYRIMDLHAGGCNRDGLAFRYMGQRLAQRQETNKLLIMISDGQPNDNGYGGSVARDDIRQGKLMLKKQGVHTFAAAIGDDKEVIKEIYKDAFLNISDLKRLPIQMVRLVQNYIL